MFHSDSFDALGVRNQVVVADEDALAAAAAIARRELEALDAAASRFRSDSELGIINRVGHGTVSPLLFELLEAAVAAARWSGGLVDPTIGGSLRAAGYDRDLTVVVRRRAAPRVDFVPATGWRSVRLDPARAFVSLAPGTELDLGATAKAHAADRIAAAADTPVLVSLGGDIAVAGQPPPDGWPVAVTDDSRGLDTGAQVVSIRAGGLATSSTSVRRWRTQRGELHHLLDPATGAPAVPVWRTVTVAAGTCLRANVAATAAVLLGEAAPGWLQSKRLPARLVRPDGAVLAVGGWPFTANSQTTEAR